MTAPHRIYIAGPMTGLPEYNYPAFNAAAARLRAQGLHVENPAENPAPPSGAWIDYMRLAVPQLMGCDTVLMLPGWSHSRGARIELQLALGLGLRLMFDTADEGLPPAAARTAAHTGAAP